MPESERRFWLNEVERLQAENLIDLAKVVSLPYMSAPDKDAMLASLLLRFGGIEEKRMRQLNAAAEELRKAQEQRHNRNVVRSLLSPRKG